MPIDWQQTRPSMPEEGVANLTFQQASEDAQQRGFAAAVGARQDVQAALFHAQVCSPQHLRDQSKVLKEKSLTKTSSMATLKSDELSRHRQGHFPKVLRPHGATLRGRQ